MADSDSSPQSSKGYIIFNLNVALIVITSVIMVLRLYVRGLMTKALGLDDLLAVISWGLAIALSSLEIVEVGNGSGTPMGQLSVKQIEAFFSLLPVCLLVFILAAGFVRLSILAFLPRLSRDRVYMRCIYLVGFFLVAITLAAFFYVLTECSPILDLFDATILDRNCRSKNEEAYMMWTHSIVGICIDIALFALPVWVIHSHMTFGAKAMQVMLVFSIGLFAIITGVVRFGIIVTTNFAINTTYKMHRVAPWTNLEVHVGLWCGSFPALQPLLRLLSYKLGLRSYLESTDKKTAPSNPLPQSQNRDWGGTGKYLTQSSAMDRESDDASARVIVSGGPSDSTTGFVEMDEIDGHAVIRMRTDVSIRVEEGHMPRDRNEAKQWQAL